MIPLGHVGAKGLAGPSIPGGSWSLPVGVPDPLVWLTPEHVIEDGTPEITRIPNRGSGGSQFDATKYGGTSNAKISQPAGWNSKDVFDTTAGTSGGYRLAASCPARTVISLSTYEAGAATFSNYDGLVANTVGGSFQMVGDSTKTNFFAGSSDTVYKDGAAIATPTSAILPLSKNGVAIQRSASGYSIQTLWHDDFSTARYWNGLTGDILIWQELLTATQVQDVHDNLIAYFTP